MKIRTSLQSFVEYQETILRIHDYKLGWESMTPIQLKKRILEEFLELMDTKNEIQMMNECADIANFCMMLYDNLLRKKMKVNSHDVN